VNCCPQLLAGRGSTAWPGSSGALDPRSHSSGKEAATADSAQCGLQPRALLSTSRPVSRQPRYTARASSQAPRLQRAAGAQSGCHAHRVVSAKPVEAGRPGPPPPQRRDPARRLQQGPGTDPGLEIRRHGPRVGGRPAHPDGPKQRGSHAPQGFQGRCRQRGGKGGAEDPVAGSTRRVAGIRMAGTKRGHLLPLWSTAFPNDGDSDISAKRVCGRIRDRVARAPAKRPAPGGRCMLQAPLVARPRCWRCTSPASSSRRDPRDRHDGPVDKPPVGREGVVIPVRPLSPVRTLWPMLKPKPHQLKTFPVEVERLAIPPALRLVGRVRRSRSNLIRLGGSDPSWLVGWLGALGSAPCLAWWSSDRARAVARWRPAACRGVGCPPVEGNVPRIQPM